MKPKNKQDQPEGLLQVLKISLSILSKKEKRKYLVFVTVQVVLNILELLALSLVVLLVTVSSGKITPEKNSKFTAEFLSLLGLRDRTNEQILFSIGLVTITIFILKTIVSVLLTSRTFKFLAQISANLTSKSLEELIVNLVPMNKEVRSTELIFTLSTGVKKFIFIILGSFSVLIADATLLLFLFLGLFFYDPIITISSVLIFGSIFGLSHLFISRKIYLIGKEITENDLAANSMILNYSRNQKEIFVRGSGSNLMSLYKKKRLRHFEAEGELLFLQNSSRFTLDIVVPLSAFLLICLQTFFLNEPQGALSLAVFLVAGSRLAPAIIKIQTNLLGMKSVSGEVESITGLLQSLQRQSDEIDSKKKNNIERSQKLNFDLVFSNVNFKYSEKDNFELTNINFHLRAGEISAIIGPSGSGKSTLIDLALGLLKPDAGDIFLANQFPHDVITSNPGSIAYVPQDTMVIGGSIRDNILFGLSHQDITDSSIMKVLSNIELLDLVNSVEFGLDEQIGEFGVSLSGGQKQKLGLARALISNPSMIILDEVTSALDITSENSIKKMLYSLKGRKTVVIVSHSKNLIEIADQVIALRNGQISEITFGSQYT